MNQEPSRFWPWAIVWAGLFAIAHTQALHYYSNQNHYYLHGYALANVGTLNEDWESNTKDPTPFYSQLVSAVYRSAGSNAFHVIFFVLLGVYFESVRRLIGALPGFPDRGPARILFLTLFLASHAAILRVASLRLTGVDYPWFLQAGLAAQYLLGPGLQPSVFGILLVTSLAAFVNERPLPACVLCGLTCVVHSTYLLPAGLIVLGYLAVLLREKQARTAFLGGLLALLIVLPILILNARTFLSGDAEQLREAQHVFADIRIPHHTSFERWFDRIAAIQLGIMGIGLVLILRTRLFLVLLIPTIVGAILSVVQVRTGSDGLALLFPWRFSVILMPISMAIIFGKLAMLVAGRLETSRTLSLVCAAIAVGLAGGGIAIQVADLGYFTNDAELPLLEHVRETKKPGEVYLIPAKFPTLKKESPASQSKTFAPPVRTGAVGIPVDFQRFRLTAEAPIYIDFKAPPYEPSEILEWQRRLSNAQRWYADRNWDGNGFLEEIRAEGITHFVTSTDKDVKCKELGEPIYADESYRIYRVAK